MTQRTREQAWKDAAPAIAAFLAGKRIRRVGLPGEEISSVWLDARSVEVIPFGDPGLCWEIESLSEHPDLTVQELFELSRLQTLIVHRRTGVKHFVSAVHSNGECTLACEIGGEVLVTPADLRLNFQFLDGRPAAAKTRS